MHISNRASCKKDVMRWGTQRASVRTSSWKMGCCCCQDDIFFFLIYFLFFLEIEQTEVVSFQFIDNKTCGATNSRLLLTITCGARSSERQGGEGENIITVISMKHICNNRPSVLCFNAAHAACQAAPCFNNLHLFYALLI